jgi:dTDP-4-amino-4,6-dideoxygalactose transaminase
MTPVFAPVDPATGNLAPTAVSPGQWKDIDAVLTTNLYGMPDDMNCLQEVKAAHGITVIEDACHAFDSSVNGRQTGSFGDCAVFSLTKHLGGAGGVILFRAEKDRAALKDMLHAALGSRWWNRLQSGGDRVRTRLFGALASPPGIGHRSPVDRAALENAIRRAPDICAFDQFLGAGGSAYRCMPKPENQAATLVALGNWEAVAKARRAQVRSFLKDRPIPANVAAPLDDSTPLRLPVFVENREETISQLADEGIQVSLVYDPPLHEHFPWIKSIVGPWRLEHSRWASRVLPLSPEQLTALPKSWRERL